MAKQILIWNPASPTSDPIRLTVPDLVATAAVRSGVATAADPAEQGLLSLGAGAVGLSASALSFLTGLAAGGLIGTLSDPYAGLGLGATSYATFGAVPGQLALSNGQIVAGNAVAVAGAAYAIGIVATSGDGKRKVGETLVFTAAADGGTTFTPSLDFSDARNSQFLL